jgi:hypothetical protein
LSLYECRHCGADECFFPGVFMAVNTPDDVYPYHGNEFELKFDEIRGEEKDIVKAWNLFWAWLGNTKVEWFCSLKCVDDYLYKLRVERDPSFTEPDTG